MCHRAQEWPNGCRSLYADGQKKRLPLSGEPLFRASQSAGYSLIGFLVACISAEDRLPSPSVSHLENIDREPASNSADVTVPSLSASSSWCLESISEAETRPSPSESHLDHFARAPTSCSAAETMPSLLVSIIILSSLAEAPKANIRLPAATARVWLRSEQSFMAFPCSGFERYI